MSPDHGENGRWKRGSEVSKREREREREIFLRSAELFV